MEQVKQFYRQIFLERKAAFWKNFYNLANQEEKQELSDQKDQINSLEIEKNQLADDRQTARLHNVALAKKENNQELNEDEEIAIRHIKTTYSSFFPSEGSGSDPEIGTSPEYEERKCVANVRNSLNQAIAAKKVELKTAKMEHNITLNAISSRIGVQLPAKESDYPSTSVYSNTSSSMQQLPKPVNQNNDATGSVASSTSSQTPSDYIDSLPKEYNPFDDLGED